MGAAVSLLSRFVLPPLLLALVVYLGLCALLFFRQRALLYYPQPLAPGAEASVRSLPGSGLPVAVSVRERAGPDALIYFGGNAEDVSRNLPAFSAAFPEHAVYLLHYRGYGASAGAPSEAALVADALALFDWAQGQHARVTVIGRSLGSGLAVRVASQRPAARMVLVTPYDSLVDLAAGLYPWLPVRWLLRDRYESWRYAPRVKAPTLIIAAEYDEVIPSWSSQRLLSRFRPGRASMAVLAGASHNTVSEHACYLPLLVGQAECRLSNAATDAQSAHPKPR